MMMMMMMLMMMTSISDEDCLRWKRKEEGRRKRL